VKAIVSEVRRNVANADNVVPDIYRNILKSQEGTGGQHRSVSDAGTLSITEQPLTAA